MARLLLCLALCLDELALGAAETWQSALSRMLLGLGNLGPVFSDYSISTAQQGGTNHPGNRLSVHHFFAKSVVRLHYLRTRIGEQYHVQVVGIDKSLMRGKRVSADTQYDKTQLFKFRLQITEACQFLDSAGCVILWIEKQ